MLKSVRRAVLALGLVIVGCATGWIAAPSALAAACPVDTPAADFDTSTLNFTTDAGIQAAFTAARAADSCPTALTLPAGFDAMTPAQQTLALVNSEREVRGEPDLKLDTTLMSTVAHNHDLEQATYGYFDHPSPINQVGVGSPGVGLERYNVNPVFSAPSSPAFPAGPDNRAWFFGENIAIGFSTPAAAVFQWMYVDSGQGWGHRGAILQPAFQWTGIDAFTGADGTAYYTQDFLLYQGFVAPGTTAPQYTPPPTADTNPPKLGAVSYANGTATVTGVADSPLNVNDTGQTPVTAGVTTVVFYTNNIVQDQTTSQFNTVSATQTAPGSGTWTAPITVNPGAVLHAVAVDGSGNFADVTTAPPATTLTAGANTVALPAATGNGPAAMTTLRRVVRSDVSVPAATRNAAALVASIDRRAHGHVVRFVKVYTGGRWRVFRPGRSANFPLFTGEGVVVSMTRELSWRPPAGQEPMSTPRIRLHRGWNFVAVPYPVTGMTCHAVRLELAHLGNRLEEISIGTTPNTGIIMKPKHGRWGNDLAKYLPAGKGFWIKDAGATTWSPSPTQYRAVGRRVR